MSAASPTSAPPAVWALLDDRDATPERPTSRLYTGHVRTHRCADPKTLDAVWDAVAADQRDGLHALLLADYEWGARLVGAGAGRWQAAEPDGGDGPALQVLMFSALRQLPGADVGRFLADIEGATEPAVAGTLHLQASVDEAAFTQAIDRIHAAIRAGETYQVNYTYRLEGSAYGSPVALYRRLRARQPVTFGAFIALPPEADGGQRHVLSCSPELFLRHDHGVLTARPMKGTASRTLAPEGDSETARLLSIDIKNRAENLMIVDLLRNDLGRIAQIGSVRVPALFAIEPYSTVFQMTSTIEARLLPDVGFADVLRATFPCGSITGAPKHHTMGLIAALESTPRGLYCGAIGWVDPAPASGQAGCGDFCLSVAIRTLTLGPERDGARPARLGIGAGIVLDSVADDEFAECKLKGRFLTRLDPGFELFETLLAQPQGGLQHVDLHLDRLGRSAVTFGFAFDRDTAARMLQRLQPEFAPGVASRVRLALASDGRLQCTHAALSALPPGPVPLLIADHRMPAADPLAAHKTTRRAAYDAGIATAERAGAFDSVFFTTDGRLAEGGRSNVFVQLDGRWWTPPVADGALPGIARALLLADADLAAAERSLTLADLRRADGLFVCNALRGRLPARLATGA